MRSFRLRLQEWIIPNLSVDPVEPTQSSQINQNVLLLGKSLSQYRDNTSHNGLHYLGVKLDELPNGGVVESYWRVLLLEVWVLETVVKI